MKVAKVLLLVLGGLVLSAIALVRLQRAVTRSAMAVAVADTKRVIAAEQSYAAANGGYFDDISRLCRRGPECVGIGIPNYPDDEPEFLEPELARPTPYRKDHYVRNWISDFEPVTLPDGVSTTSVWDYCYASTPGNWLVPYGLSYSDTGAGAMAVAEGGLEISCPIPPQGWIE